jgi:threonine dehydrogenase-like Zn-dependent dehydrogenase
VRATLLYQFGDVRVEDVPDPKMPHLLDGEIHPGRVFDRTVPLDQVAEAWRLMNDREALKVLIRP